MNNDLSPLLNDKTVNRIADLYLDFLGLDKSSMEYCALKSAVICSIKTDDVQQIYAELEKTNNCSAGRIERCINKVIEGLPEPIEDMFNNTYCGEQDIGFMPHYKTTDHIIGFLGKTLLYILKSNYRAAL